MLLNVLQKKLIIKLSAQLNDSVMCCLQVIMFFICAMLLAIRGATGVVAIYLPYQQYWVEDRLFYPLDTFPEYLTLIMLSWPAFMAQMAQAYPRATKGQSNKKGNADTGSKADQQQGANGHAYTEA